MNGDQDFIKKVYRSIVYAWAVAMCWALAFQKPWIALSITMGTVIGTALLASCEHIVRRVIVSDAVRPRRALLKFALLKYPLIGIILYVSVRWDRVNLPAFCGGIVLVHAAIIAKMIGIRIAERSQRP
jgi:hypothetical protein